MRIFNSFDDRDRACIAALFLQDEPRVKVIIDDGLSTVPHDGLASVFDSQLPDVIDGNSEALIYVPDKFKNLNYLDENYEEKSVYVSPQTIYVFKMVDGVMTVISYSGTAIRQLLVEGM